VIHPVIVSHHAHLAAVDLGDRAAVESACGVDVDVPVDADYRPYEACHKTKIVGHEDYGDVLVELLQQLEEILLHLLIETGGGLVQKQQIGVSDEGAGEQDALSLPT
jgi:hypothetical protein